MTEEHVESDSDFGDDADDASTTGRKFVTGLSRGLKVLSCFKGNEVLLSNAEIAKRTGLPKSTVTRLAYTLVNEGYLDYSESEGKFLLGTAVVSLGNAFLTKNNIRQVARPLMLEVADYARAAVALGVRDRLQMVYLEVRQSEKVSFSIHMEAGSHVDLVTTAIGNAYLCGMQERQRDQLLDQIMLHDKQGWPAHKQIIEQSLRDYQDRGFCMSIGNWRKDVNAVGVPYIPSDGSDVYAFNCAGLGFQLRRHQLEDDLGPRLVSLVARVKEELERKV